MATATKKYVDDAMAQPVDVMCGDLFDHIDDLLDFPNDDDMRGMDDYQCGPAPPATAPAFTPLLPLHADGLLGGDGGGGDSSDGSGDGACGAASAIHRAEEKLDPWDDLDIAEPEWLSSFFVDNDSFTVDFPQCNTTTAAAGAAAAAAAATAIGTDGSNNNSGNSKEYSLFRTCSPVSVLEPSSLSIGGSGGGGSSSSSSSSFSSSSSSCSGSGGGSSSARAREAPPISHPEPILVVPARARSKRPRPASFSCRPHVTIPFLPPSSDNIPAPTPVYSFSSSQSESFAESNPGPDTMKQKMTKKKSCAGTAAGGDEAPPVRKCMHCEIQKTPQWRAGPMGPKTLCNACGVRYKSGRLFPEYRPAASPTFVPSLHSNSHRKVVEMRLKASERAVAPGPPSPESASKDSCDLLAYIRRRE